MSLMSRWRRLWRRPLSARRIRRIAELAQNPFAQPDVRSRQMERLLEDGSPAALAGLLGRFTTLAQGHIADEEEKTWLVGALVEHGEAALPPLADYIRTNSKLAHALRAYLGIAKAEASAQFFAQVLADKSPLDHRSAEAKAQLIAALGACAPTETLIEALGAKLEDLDDDVVQAVLTVLGQRLLVGDAPPSAARGLLPSLVQRLTDPATPPRVARLVTTFLVEAGWALPAEARQLPAALAEEFAVDVGGRLCRRERLAEA